MKSGLDVLADLEKSVLERTNDMMMAMSKQMADKSDTKKAFKLLEKQIRNIYELFLQKTNQSGLDTTDDEPMFTTKPLGGTSCASC